jgi:hypothetical protein
MFTQVVRSELTVVVEEFDRPKHLRLRTEDKDAIFNIDYDLEATPEGTLLTQTDHIDWEIPRLVRPIGGLMVSRDIRRQ